MRPHERRQLVRYPMKNTIGESFSAPAKSGRTRAIHGTDGEIVAIFYDLCTEIDAGLIVGEFGARLFGQKVRGQADFFENLLVCLIALKHRVYIGHAPLNLAACRRQTGKPQRLYLPTIRRKQFRGAQAFHQAREYFDPTHRIEAVRKAEHRDAPLAHPPREGFDRGAPR